MKKIVFLLLLSLPIFGQNNALNFDGTNDYITTTGGNVTGGGARTVEAWIRTNANCIPNAGGVQQVVLEMGTTGIGTRYTLNLLWSNSVRLEIGGSGLSGTTAVNDNSWHHIAAVYDPSATEKHSLYIDGQLEKQGNISTLNTGNGSLIIGRRVDGVNPFTGDIDEVRVWNTALSSTDIAAHYNQEICGAPSNLIAYYTFNQGVSSGNNTGLNTLTDQVGSNTGTLNNFALTGSTSNWVTGQNLSNVANGQLTDTVCLGMWSPDGSAFWDTTGTYYHTFTSPTACDSIVRYELTVESVDTSVTVTLSSPTVLIANAANATSYQWVNCADSSLISGATAPSFTPTANGTYAAIITSGNCTVWSSCTSVQGIGIEETDLEGILYPNPSRGLVHVPNAWEGHRVRVMEATGREVKRLKAEGATLHLEDLPAGSYVLQCRGAAFPLYLL